MKKILLLSDFSSGFSRSLLEGIINFAKECNDWTFYRMPSYYRDLHGDDGVVKWAKRWGANAIIAQFTEINITALKKLRIPIIVQNYKIRHPQLSNITGDYIRTGEIAAEFFLQKGYKHFAFYGYNNTVWMRERRNGFVSKLKESGYNTFLYADDDKTETLWDFNYNMLKDWLDQLPKPVALFACDDAHALQITELCKMVGIDIPNEIGVLGVDNDELLCNISDPKLSSIELDVANGGYQAGMLLQDFFEKKIIPPVNIVIKPIQVVTRESTEKFIVSNKYIKKVIDLIHEKYDEDISVIDIVNSVPFSRRVLEKLFKKETGTTIYKYLLFVRVENFSKLLVETEIPLVDAAFECGLYDYNNVSRVFLKSKKMTPYQFRKSYSKIQTK